MCSLRVLTLSNLYVRIIFLPEAMAHEADRSVRILVWSLPPIGSRFNHKGPDSCPPISHWNFPLHNHSGISIRYNKETSSVMTRRVINRRVQLIYTFHRLACDVLTEPSADLRQSTGLFHNLAVSPSTTLLILRSKRTEQAREGMTRSSGRCSRDNDAPNLAATDIPEPLSRLRRRIQADLG